MGRVVVIHSLRKPMPWHALSVQIVHVFRIPSVIKPEYLTISEKIFLITTKGMEKRWTTWTAKFFLLLCDHYWQWPAQSHQPPPPPNQPTHGLLGLAWVVMGIVQHSCGRLRSWRLCYPKSMNSDRCRNYWNRKTLSCSPVQVGEPHIISLSLGIIPCLPDLGPGVLQTILKR